MKKTVLIVSIIAITMVAFYSCTKNTNESVTEEQAVQNLVASGNFIAFTGHFISDFSALMQYHRSSAILADKNGFLAQVKLASGDGNALSGAYRSFALNYETAMGLKNRIDNDLLGLLNQHKFLLRFSEEQVQRIIVKAIDEGVHSADQRWVDVKRSFRFDRGMAYDGRTTATNGLRTTGTNRVEAGLSLDEVWACVKSALGLGTASIIGIAGVTKLAEQGIQQVVITASKWIAERAGWWGLAITLIDFGVCIYNETKD